MRHRFLPVTVLMSLGLWLLMLGAAFGAQPFTIVAMGDSLTAGLGVAESQAYPALLEQRLRLAGYAHRVINAGVSGETSAGALARVDWILALKPDLVILETGANDGLRGLSTQMLAANLEGIVLRFKSAGVPVVLCGMQMTPNLGPAYVKAFNQIYPKLAAKHDLVFMPFFLKDVAGESALNQSDGIHPTARGYEKVVDNLVPYVTEVLKEMGNRD